LVLVRQIVRSPRSKLTLVHRLHASGLDVTVEGDFTAGELRGLIDHLVSGLTRDIECIRIQIGGVSPICVDLLLELKRIARLGEFCIVSDGQRVWEFPLDCLSFAESMESGRRLRAA
jgi:hypothetical protein